MENQKNEYQSPANTTQSVSPVSVKRFKHYLSAGLLIISAQLFSQPTHTINSSYNTVGAPAGYADAVPPNAGGFNHYRFDVAVHNSLNYHLESGTTFSNISSSNDFTLVKKNATTGAFLADIAVDMGALQNQAASFDICHAMYFDEVAQLAYLVGHSGSSPSKAVMICINTATMSVNTAFGINGFVPLSNLNSKALDITKAKPGNLIVLCNVSTASGNVMHVFSLQTTGQMTSFLSITNSSFGYFGNRIRMTPDESFVMISGHALSSANIKYPMVWSASMLSTPPFTMTFFNVTSNSLTNAMGSGEWLDFTFMRRVPNASNPYNYDIIVGGKNVNTGIYAKYSMQTMTAYGNYTNNGIILPGTTPGYWIERILIDPANYVTCLTNNSGNAAAMGYISVNGQNYTQTYVFANWIHNVQGLNKGTNGKILVGGCSSAFCTVLLNCYGSTWSSPVNRMVSAVSTLSEQSNVDRTEEQCRLITSSPINQGNELLIYPNPVLSELFIKAAADEVITQFEIYDISGKIVMNQQVSFEGTKSVDISSLPSGIYTIRIYGNSGYRNESFNKL
jgi:Secretion system C-terminal sorting domain